MSNITINQANPFLYLLNTTNFNSNKANIKQLEVNSISSTSLNDLTLSAATSHFIRAPTITPYTDSSTKVATTEFVQNVVASVINNVMINNVMMNKVNDNIVSNNITTNNLIVKDYFDISGGIVLNNNGKGVELVSDAQSFGTNSDNRLIKNITSLDTSLSTLLQLKPVNYLYNDDKDDIIPHYGFIAQDVNILYPNSRIVTTSIKSVKEQDEIISFNPLCVSLTEFIPYIIRALQEQNELIVSQTKTINDMQIQISTLIKQVASIKKS